MENAITALENEQYLRVKHVRPIQQISARPSDPLCDHMTVDAMERLINAAFKGEDKVIHPHAKLSLYFSQAQIYHFRGSYEEAIKSLRESLKISPRLDTVLELVYLYRKAGQEQLAIDYLEQMIASPPVNLPESIFGVASCASGWNRLNKIIKMVKRCCAKSGRSVDGLTE